MQTQEKFSISAGKVREYKDFKVNSTNDVKALENLGIYITPEFTQQAKQFAMDSNFIGGLTTPSITTPVQFLQQWLPGFVEVITRARKLTNLLEFQQSDRGKTKKSFKGLVSIQATQLYTATKQM